MDRRDLIEIALGGSKSVDISEEASDIYVEIAEHLLAAGHANTIQEIDTILSGMSVESAERILENHLRIAAGEEEDPEGYMVLRQLATAEIGIKRIRRYVDNRKDLQLPAWVQARITTSCEALDAVGDYLVTDPD